MLVVIGFIVVAFSVFGGFVMAGGHLASLLQPIELLMIGGAAAGALAGSAANTVAANIVAIRVTIDFILKFPFWLV